MSATTPADLAILRRRAAQQRERAAMGETKWCLSIREDEDCESYLTVYARDPEHALCVAERRCAGMRGAWTLCVDGPADPMAAPEAFCEVVA